MGNRRGAKSGGTDVSSSISPSDYRQLVKRIRERIRTVVPPAATVLVVSRGDDDLTGLEGRHGWHFPREPDGRYTGYHPRDSDGASMHLELLRREGADYFVLPSTSYWWLDHYDDFQRHLHDHHRLLSKDGDCIIFQLVAGQLGHADTELTASSDRPDPGWEGAMIAGLVQALLPTATVAAVLRTGEEPAVAPAGCRNWRLPEAVLANERRATEALGELVAGGVEFLVIPSSTYGLLEQEETLADSLGREHRLVTCQRHVGAIYELASRGGPRRRTGELQDVRVADAGSEQDLDGTAETPARRRGLGARVLSGFSRDVG